MENIDCSHCGRSNSPESEFCWACYENLHAPKETAAARRQAAQTRLANDSAAEEDVVSRSGIWASAGRFILIIGLAFFYSRWFTAANYFSPVDHVNLAFHEAGHIFLGLFGRFIMTAGGTIFQLLIPALCAAHLWRQGNRLGWQLCVFWFGENFLNISMYAGDAINQALPLVGGGVHDWTYLLTETHLIAHTPATARFIFVIGSVFIFCALGFIGLDGFNLLPRIKK